MHGAPTPGLFFPWKKLYVDVFLAIFDPFLDPKITVRFLTTLDDKVWERPDFFLICFPAPFPYSHEERTGYLRDNLKKGLSRFETGDVPFFGTFPRSGPRPYNFS